MNFKKVFTRISSIHIVIFILAFLTLIIGCFHIYCIKKSNKIVTYEQNSDTILTDDKDIYIVFSTPPDKLWMEPSHFFGAQYDGKFYNNTNHTFTDWTVTVQVPESYWVDSTWNFEGTYYYSESKPIPKKHSDYPEYLRQYESEIDYIEMRKIQGNKATEISSKNTIDKDPFMLGMIMYTPFRFDVSRVKITGRFIYAPTDFPIYYVLLIAIGITSVSLVTLIIVNVTVKQKLRYYELSQKLNFDIMVQSFKTFANLIYAKDAYTKEHSLRVAAYAREIAKRMYMSEQEQMEIYWCGLMHDVGKIGIAESILHKPTNLTPEEYDEIQSHTTKGYEMLCDFTTIPKLKEVAKSHHEHWDGTGYCEHLKGEQIPLEARIICVCDTFDAMNTDRCYRHSLTKDKIVEEFKKYSGTYFEPKIAKIMLEMIQDGSVEKIGSIENIDYK